MDITSKNRSTSEMHSAILEYMDKELSTNYSKEILIEDNEIEVPNIYKDIVAFPENILDIQISRVTNPFVYYILKIDYYYGYTSSYIYLDENYKPINDIISERANRFSVDEFLEVINYKRKFIFNRKGEIIWMEKMK